MRQIISLVLTCCFVSVAQAQLQDYSFGDGLNYTAKDSSFSIKFGFRFQTLFSNKWNVENDNLAKIEENNSSIRIRRSRLKFDGYAFSPKVAYKFELGISNQDIRHNNPTYFGEGGNIIL